MLTVVHAVLLLILCHLLLNNPQCINPYMATLFLLNMSKPHQVIPDLFDVNVWIFYPRKLKDGIVQPKLWANCNHLIETAQIFKGRV